MGFHYSDTLNKHDWVGGGSSAYVYHVSPTIVVKTVRPDRSPEEEIGEHPLLKDLAFYEQLNTRQDRCLHIVECFLMLPDHLFLSFCANQAIIYRFHERQERENCHFFGRLIRVKDYEDPALIARWIQQLTSALECVEKMGFCHNDLNTTNCLLDENFNLKLTDFGRATTIGQFLEYTGAPWAMRLAAGPLKGTYSLCSARTEQFAVGSLLYFMVYGHKPYEDINLDGPELERQFEETKFPELSRHEFFDGLIFGCWYNVYPTMALVAYDFKRKTEDIASITEYETIDRTKGEENLRSTDPKRDTRPGIGTSLSATLAKVSACCQRIELPVNWTEKLLEPRGLLESVATWAQTFGILLKKAEVLSMMYQLIPFLALKGW